MTEAKKLAKIFKTIMSFKFFSAWTTRFKKNFKLGAASKEKAFTVKIHYKFHWMYFISDVQYTLYTGLRLKNMQVSSFLCVKIKF